MLRFAVVALLLTLAPVATGQSTECAKLRDPKSVAGLGMDEVERRFGDCVVTGEMFAAGWGGDPALVEQWLAAFNAGILQQHRYGILDDAGQPIDEAIREFQMERGDPVTGMLTVRQLSAVGKLTSGKPTNIWMTGGTSFFGDEGDKPDVFLTDDYLSVTGSWWLDGPDRIMDPLNKHIYECDLTKRICHHAEMSLSMFSDDQLGASLHLETLRVSRVDLPIVEITPHDQACRRPVITVNVERKEVFQVTTQVSECPLIPDLAVPRIARMRSPQIQSKQYREEAEIEQLEAGSKRWRDFASKVKAAGDKGQKSQ